jgi:hypothetical protein
MMGFTPAQINEMSLWEYAACIDGWNRGHGDGKSIVAPPTDEQFEAAKRLHGDV